MSADSPRHSSSRQNSSNLEAELSAYLERSNLQAASIPSFYLWAPDDVARQSRTGGEAREDRESRSVRGSRDTRASTRTTRDSNAEDQGWPIARGIDWAFPREPRQHRFQTTDPDGPDYLQPSTVRPSSGPSFVPLSSADVESHSLPPLRSLYTQYIQRPPASLNSRTSSRTRQAYPLQSPPPAPSPPLPSFPLFSSRPPHTLISLSDDSTLTTPNNSLPSWRSSRARPSSTISSVISRLDEIGHNLDDANSHLRALLDLPTTDDILNINTPPRAPPLPHSDNMSSRSETGVGIRRESSRSDEPSRVSKRRRLDADKSATPAFKGFRYGRYGQVEPGPLTMEIVSCDGGLYSDETHYAAENILKSDNSVYCTKGNRCNIVLQHQGCTTFSLKELIIKAPGRNYSSPVREGLVFLSMSKDELVQSHQYQSNVTTGMNAPTSSRHSSSRGEDNSGYNPSSAMLAAHISRLERPNHDEDASNARIGRVTDEIFNFMMDDSDQEPPTQTGVDGLASSTTFRVLTECSDDENDEPSGRGRGGRGDGLRGAAGWSPTPLDRRARRRRPGYFESAPFGSHLVTWDVDGDYDDDDDDDDDTELFEIGDATLASPESSRQDRYGNGAERRSRGRYGEGSSPVLTSGPLFDGGDGTGSSDRHNQTNTSTGEGTHTQPPTTNEFIAPHARFHIEKNKNKCTIHFDPPVTARYILLKMWNPRPDMAGNIDIQGVVAKGFAGPRYFPALELR